MSKLNKLRDLIAATSRMNVEYLKPVPLHKTLRVESKEIGKRGRRLTRVAEIVDDKGTVLARSRGVFVIIDPNRVFRRGTK
jgi:acyl-CoA thioesterase FadM